MIVRRLLESLEHGNDRPFQDFQTGGVAKPPYKCPSCNERRPYQNRRVIRLPGGATIAICRQCHKSGPTIVGTNLRKNGIIK